MKITFLCLLLYLMILGCNSQQITFTDIPYPSSENRIKSAEKTTYYIDPNIGNDENLGTDKNKPWRSFKKVNQLVLTKGNRIEILSAGSFYESLFIIGEGTEKSPITVSFARGMYNFYPEKAYKSKFHISNTNDAPDSLKAIAFYFLDSKNITINAIGAKVSFRGKVIETCINNCENVNIEGFEFDYYRPTVSELKVVKTRDHFADVQIHNDSKYNIIDSTLIWIGEGWQHKAQPLWQIFNPEDQTVRRNSLPINKLRFSEIANNQVRIHFKENPGFIEGLIYQNRDTFRDYAAVFINQSKNISWKNINIYFMHGLGFVSQMCETITFDSMYIGPRKGSGRTCAAWADIFHFSGCKGKLEVSNSYLSAANDDAVNVHGTHLRIIEKLSNRIIKVSFMHPQTYGFNAFIEGDSVEFIRAKSLLPYSTNLVSKTIMLNDKEIELTFEKDIPEDIQINDVIENISWIPDVNISNSTIVHIPTRGILVTSRGKVVIENNLFSKTHMSAILIADDANNWFESGYVRNVTIQNNKFMECGEPVISINPENREISDKYPVHKNITITNNQFKLQSKSLLFAKSTGNINVSDNLIEVKEDMGIDELIKFEYCFDIHVKANPVKKVLETRLILNI